MSLQYSSAIETARLNELIATIGPGSTMSLFTSSPPANCQQPDPSGFLMSIPLPNPLWNPPSGTPLSITLVGNVSAISGQTGQGASFRIYDNTGTCHIQGTVSAVGGGGDMQASNNNFVNGSPVTITIFTIAPGNQ